MKEQAGALRETFLCPSAQPETAGARVIGVVERSAEAPRVAYLNQQLPVTDDLLKMAGTLKPTEIFRFGARCEERACSHFDGARCQLATRIVQILPVVSETLPACVIRSECRWFAQEGRAACMRCPQVVTETPQASETMRKAAAPALSVVCR